MEVTEVLKCPKTGNKLRFDDSNSVVVVEDSAITYPIKDGIVDFCPEVRDKVSRCYDGFASSYDTYFTSSSLSYKVSMYDLLKSGFNLRTFLTVSFLSFVGSSAIFSTK